MSSQKDRTVDVMLRRPHFLRTPLPDPTPTYANLCCFFPPASTFYISFCHTYHFRKSIIQKKLSSFSFFALRFSTTAAGRLVRLQASVTLLAATSGGSKAATGCRRQGRPRKGLLSDGRNQSSKLILSLAMLSTFFHRLSMQSVCSRYAGLRGRLALCAARTLTQRFWQPLPLAGWALLQHCRSRRGL